MGAVPCADIAVPEHGRELRFYARILTTGERPLWREDLMSRGGLPVIGLGPRMPEHAKLPLQWMPHIQVADVAASADRALALGGRELMRDTGGGGPEQWAVLGDPNGAAFGIIPVAGAAPSGPGPSRGTRDPAGRISRIDLTVPDASAIRDFYRDVVAWTVRDVTVGDEARRSADYAMCTPDGSPVAHIRDARGVKETLPPVWLIFLPVGDLAESLRRVREEDGEVLQERKGTDGEISHAVIRDPVGACLGLKPG